MNEGIISVRRLPSFKHSLYSYYLILDGKDSGVLEPEAEPQDIMLKTTPGTHTLSIELRFLGLRFPSSEEVHVAVIPGQSICFVATAFERGLMFLLKPIWPPLWIKPTITLRLLGD